MILIVDHRSRLPKEYLIKADCNTEFPGEEGIETGDGCGGRRVSHPAFGMEINEGHRMAPLLKASANLLHALPEKAQ